MQGRTNEEEAKVNIQKIMTEPSSAQSPYPRPDGMVLGEVALHEDLGTLCSRRRMASEGLEQRGHGGDTDDQRKHDAS